MKRANNKSNLEIIQNYVDGYRPFTQIGYDADLANSERKEGDEWTDSQNRKWIKKNGHSVRVSKNAKVIIEQRCKECNADVRWGNYLDDQVWPKTQLCYDCFIEEETNQKINGVWEIKNKLRDLTNTKSILLDYKQNFNEALEHCNKSHNTDVQFMEEDGSIEKWCGKEDLSELIKNIKSDIEVVDARLDTIDEDIEKYNKELKDYEQHKTTK